MPANSLQFSGHIAPVDNELLQYLININLTSFHCQNYLRYNQSQLYFSYAFKVNFISVMCSKPTLFRLCVQSQLYFSYAFKVNFISVMRSKSTLFQLCVQSQLYFSYAFKVNFISVMRSKSTLFQLCVLAHSWVVCHLDDVLRLLIFVVGWYQHRK